MFGLASLRGTLQAGVIRSADRFDADGNLLSGYCYFRMFSEEHHPLLMANIGMWPSLGVLMQLPAAWLSPDVLRLKVVDAGNKKIHVEDVDHGRLLVERFGITARMAWQDSERRPSVGSVGEAMGKGMPPLPADREIDESEWLIGGQDVDWDAAVGLLDRYSDCVTSDVLARFFMCFTRGSERLVGLDLEDPSVQVPLGVVESLEGSCVSDAGGVQEMHEKAEACVVWNGVVYASRLERNQATRAKKKMRKMEKRRARGQTVSVSGSDISSVGAGAGGPSAPSARVGYFSDCDGDLRRKLQESRALRLVEENLCALQDAKNRRDCAAFEADSGVQARRQEIARLSVEKRLSNLIENGGLSESVLGGEEESGSSMSPDSSISVAFEMKLRRQLAAAQREVGVLKKEVQEIKAHAREELGIGNFDSEEVVDCEDVNHDYHNPYG
jgi:hypothetical protein